jgi:hypothetical protein
MTTAFNALEDVGYYICECTPKTLFYLTSVFLRQSLREINWNYRDQNQCGCHHVHNWSLIRAKQVLENPDWERGLTCTTREGRNDNFVERQSKRLSGALYAQIGHIFAALKICSRTVMKALTTAPLWQFVWEIIGKGPNEPIFTGL